MSQTIAIELEVPDDLAGFRLPGGVNRRLTGLLDRQDRGEPLTAEEREEADGLVNLAETLSLLRLRCQRAASNGSTQQT
ncbi:MAG TPA: hypothetical protein VJ783_22855 [Pirellulales bacterium]|nr:hypothetical protein [Pirellulales bacterium]